MSFFWQFAQFYALKHLYYLGVFILLVTAAVSGKFVAQFLSSKKKDNE